MPHHADTANSSLASRLKSLRQDANLSLAELAKRAGISKTYLWELEKDEAGEKSVSVDVAKRLAASLSVGLLDLVGRDAEKPFPTPRENYREFRRPITEDWLANNGFRIESGRNDDRFPIRSLHIGSDFIYGRNFLGASDDLCIDVSPAQSNQKEWHVWIAQHEPYRFIPARFMKETWEIVRLYEGLTGRLWPGEL